MSSSISYITTVDYCGDFIYVNGKLKRILILGSYITFRNDSTRSSGYAIQTY